MLIVDVLVKKWQRKVKLEQALDEGGVTVKSVKKSGEVVYSPSPLLFQLNQLEGSINKTVELLMKKSKSNHDIDVTDFSKLLETSNFASKGEK